MVSTHPRQTRGRATRLEHYPPAGQAFLRGTPAACLEQAQAIGPASGALVAALLEPYTLMRLREVQALLRLRERYPDARIERAGARAREGGDGRYRTVQGLLERGLDLVEPPAPPAPRATPAFLRGPAAFVVSAAREAGA